MDFLAVGFVRFLRRYFQRDSQRYFQRSFHRYFVVVDETVDVEMMTT